MKDNKKSPQVAGTTSEEQRMECDRCGSLILKSDNYCSYCRNPNNIEAKTRDKYIKLSVLSLVVSSVVLILILSS